MASSRPVLACSIAAGRGRVRRLRDGTPRLLAFVRGAAQEGMAAAAAAAARAGTSKEPTVELSVVAPDKKGHHRRTSSLWVPPSRPTFSNPTPIIRQKAETSGRALKDLVTCRCLSCCPFADRTSATHPEYRKVIPNHKFDSGTPRYEHPNRTKYADNRIRTTKYSLLTFLPKNLFEQFHRFANLYFIFIVMLNWVPAIEAFGRYLSMIPITFVLMVTAVKDAFEDWRRYKSDEKINHATCRIWDNEQGRYRKMEWRHVLVGDFVHLSCNEIIPADILLLRSSDPLGTCYVETSNLDGESNLKQRQVVASLANYSKLDSEFKPTDFTATIECEAPNNQIYRFNGNLLYEDGTKEAVSKNNLLLRGCEMRNTDFIEGIVLYADLHRLGRDTKAMLNNSGPRYKRSELERLTNWDIVWCVVILLVMCVTGAVFSTIWLNAFDDPYKVAYLTFVEGSSSLKPELEGFINFWSYIIVLQVMIPISLYVSIEIIKLGQVYFMSQDMEMYYEPADKRIQCRALNIPEELGQIQFVMSDKTGTLTENQMIFRRCAVAGVDYGASSSSSNGEARSFPGVSGQSSTGKPLAQLNRESVADVAANADLVQRIENLPDELFLGDFYNGATMTSDGGDDDDESPDEARANASDIYHFFINMALCNTVVVNAQPHQDRLDESGFFVGDSFVTGNSAFHVSATDPDTPDQVVIVNDKAATALPYRNSLEAPVRPSVRLPPINQRRTVAALTPLETQIEEDLFAARSASETALKSESGETVSEASADASKQPKKHKETSFAIPEIRTTEHSEAEDNGEENENESEPSQPAEASTRTNNLSARPSMLSLNLSKLNIKGFKGLSPLLRFKKGQTSERSESPAPPTNPIYEAESPDELSLVYAASAYGVRLLKRHVNSVVIELAGGRRQRFELLHTLPFDSERKRMSVIVRSPITNRAVLYCKGADSAVMDTLSERFKNDSHGQMVIFKSQQYLSLYASYGLRTLCLAKRELDDEEYREWKQMHDEAEMCLENRERLIFESAMRVETDLELVGVTGIEDRLQDGVPECIEALRRAGLKVWVLTGDKIETAVNIAYASKLFSPGMELIQLSAKNEHDTSEMLDHYVEMLENRLGSTRASGRRARVPPTADEGGALLEMPANAPAAAGGRGGRSRIGLVVNGQTLAFCLLPTVEDKFVRIVSRCTSVLCCRATPLQKASVVKLAKERLKGKVLAIGDGANDVSMIQCADVGVGISGQEGMQAVMASDFALARFRFLQRLLLVHGHWCYDRLARTILYFFYKNALFVFAIFWYQLFNGFSSQVPIDPIYLMIYNLVFTSVPSLLYGIYEQDAPDTLLLDVPRLYSLGRLGRLYRWYSFWINIVDALWQSVAIYFVTHMTYIDTDTDMWTFGFLLCAELLMVNSFHLAIEVKQWTIPFFLSLTLSFLAYFVFALTYNLFVGPEWNVKDPPNMVAEHALIDIRFWAALIISCVLALLPRFAIQVLLNTHQPSDVLAERIKKRAKTATSGPNDGNFVKSFRARWSRKEKTVRIIPDETGGNEVQVVEASVLHL